MVSAKTSEIDVVVGLEELTRTLEVKESFVRHRLVPRLLAMVYYQLSLVLYLLKPR